MNTRRNTTRRIEEEIANGGALPLGDQVPHLEEHVNDDQAPVNPPPLTDGAIQAFLFQMAKPLLPEHNPPLLKPKP